MQRDLDVSILIVSYNTREMTRACLDSIAAQTQTARYEIIALDNASSDGSAEAIGAHPARPRLLALDRNVGFAEGNNIAARQARGEYLLLLNPDTVVLDGAIDELVAFARRMPEAGIWGGRTLYADGRLNPASCWARMTPWNLFCRATGLTGLFRNTELFNGEAFGGWQRDSERQVDIVSGCFLLIPKTLWIKLGGFDPLFFMYGEEADLCLRAGVLGARPRVTPRATIIHHGGASERARADKMVRLLAAKASLIARHWSGFTKPLGLALNMLWPLSRLVALRVAARMAGTAALRAAADTWGEIWRRRSTWRGGYATRAAPTSDGSAAAASLAGAS